MKARTRDVLGSLFMFVFVVSLWLQRDFSTPFGAIFPDIIMGCLVLLVAVTVALMFTPWRAVKDDEEKQKSTSAHWFDMLVVGAIMLAWTVLLRPVGFTVTGLIGFGSISWFLNEQRNSLRGFVQSSFVSIVMVGLLILIFEYLLKVPLPKGIIFD